MVKLLKYSLSFALIVVCTLVPAQNAKIDSLLTLVKNTKTDTNKVNTLNELAWELRNDNPDTAIILTGQAFSILKSLNVSEQWKQIAKGNCLHQLGEFYWRMGDYPKALDNDFKALAVWEELGKDPSVSPTFILKSLSPTLTNIGIVYRNQGDYPNALNYYLKALRNFESLGDKNKIAAMYGNIGGVYYNQTDYVKALEYYMKALKTFEEAKDLYKMSILLGNIGLVYRDQNNYPKALDHYLQALNLSEKLEDKNGMARHFDNIGSIYKDQGDYIKAEDYYLKALTINQSTGNKSNQAINFENIGVLYAVKGEFKKAEDYFIRSIALSKEIGDIEGLKGGNQNLSAVYDTMGRAQLALKHFKLYIAYRDSLQNEENTKKQTQLEMQYMFDKKQTADSIRNAEHIKQEGLKHEQEIRQQKIYTYGGVIGFLLMIVVAGISYRAFKQKQRSNELISAQKLLVEEKQKEILDSIHYAKRIQKSLLPTEKYIEKKLKG